MSVPVTLGAPAGATVQPPAPRPPQTVDAAAKQFEAIMIAQLFKEAHGEDGRLAGKRRGLRQCHPGWNGRGTVCAGLGTERGPGLERSDSLQPVGARKVTP